MNKEEIDKWLDNEYGMSYTRLEDIQIIIHDLEKGDSNE